MLIDGALRREEMGTQSVPVLITDLTEAEADLLLAVFDPIAAMAETDKKQLESLLNDINASDEALSAMISEFAISEGIIPEEDNDEDVELRQIGIKAPPVMTWVLCGIPTVRFGEISEHVEAMALVEGILLETLSNGK